MIALCKQMYIAVKRENKRPPEAQDGYGLSQYCKSKYNSPLMGILPSYYLKWVSARTV